MKVYKLHREQFVPCPRDKVFDFFSRPENLARLTPASLGFKILTPGPVPMSTGSVIDYSVGIIGVRTHWRTLIMDYNPPESFVDVQLKGPYLLWHHTHRFVEENGGTKVIDEVNYVMPLGWVGRMARALTVKRQLYQIFDYRHKVIEKLFGEENT